MPDSTDHWRAATPAPLTSDKWLDRLDPARLARRVLRPGVRLALAWLLALVAGGVALGHAWIWADNPGRGDGNGGHATVDFAGQWLMGRMVVAGEGRHLYDRTRLRAALEAAFPQDEGDPARPDVEDLLGLMVARHDPEARTPHLGGPLYPPTHAVLYASLGLLPPRPAYRLMQCLNLGVISLCGWLASRLSEGRVWWPVAAFALMVFPGFNGAINLGQNPALSLALLLLGWWLMAARGRPLFGGAVWGLLAFKPVWAVAFFPALPLTGRWRAAAGMAVVGIAFAALTLPVVGFPVWLDWLEVGRLGSAGYDRDQSWIFLSRDLLGIPRRWLLSFEDNQATNPDAPLPAILGRALWLGCASITVALGLLRRRAVRSATGPGPAFVLLGAWLSCYHFMYYDVLLAALPLCLLFTEPARYLGLTFWPRPREPLSPALLAYYRPTLADLTPPPVPLLASGRTPRWVRNPLPPTLLALLIGLSYAGPILDPTWHFPPWDTFCLLALWAWCAARVLRAETPGEGGA